MTGDRDTIGGGTAEPYTPDELAAVRPIIEQHNRPGSVQRRLLATLDQYKTDVADVEAVLRRAGVTDDDSPTPRHLRSVT